jgi:hypothetical protein
MNTATTLPPSYALILRGLLLILGMAASLQPFTLQALTLTWRAPDSGPDVAGYYVYVKRDATTPLKLDVGDVTSYKVNELTPGTQYSFHVTAYNQHGLESDPSNTFSYAVPSPQSGPKVTLTRVGQYGLLLTWSSVEGRSYFVWEKNQWNHSWSLLTSESPVTAIGPLTSWLVQTSTSDQGFYHIQDLSVYSTGR